MGPIQLWEKRQIDQVDAPAHYIMHKCIIIAKNVTAGKSVIL